MKLSKEYCDTNIFIVGSGPSGISTALRLKERGIKALILERSKYIAGNWSNRIPDQYMTTPFSSLKLRKNDCHKKWLTGQEYWLYLKKVVEESNLNVELNWEVTSIEREDNCWKLMGPRGDISCSILVIATGQHDKRRSTLKSDGSVRILHSSDFTKQHHQLTNALVVGLGTSGADITTALAECTGNVYVSMRTIPVILPRVFLGIPITKFGELAHFFPDKFIDFVGDKISQFAFGSLYWDYTRPIHRLSERQHYQYAPIVDGGFVKQLKNGHIKLRPGFVEIVDGSAVFEDGGSLKPNIIIDATGYQASYADLFTSANQLDTRPTIMYDGVGPDSSATLFKVGLRQHLDAFASFVRSDSNLVASKIYRELQKMHAQTEMG